MSEVKENVAAIETFEEATPVEEKKIVYIGKIRDCDKLNVREKPSVDAKVLCKLDKNSEVLIDKTNSTKEFYNVVTSSGVEGYCMKKYMSIKKQEV